MKTPLKIKAGSAPIAAAITPPAKDDRIKPTSNKPFKIFTSSQVDLNHDNAIHVPI
jgi:hypothetical protein